jgi:hypothetical protein
MNSERQTSTGTGTSYSRDEAKTWGIISATGLTTKAISEVAKQLSDDPAIIAYIERAGTVGLAAFGAAAAAGALALYEAYNNKPS